MSLMYFIYMCTGDGHAQDKDQNLEGTPNVVQPVPNGSAMVNQNVVRPVPNGSSMVNQNGGASVNQNGDGMSTSNHKIGTHPGYPKPPLSTSPADCTIDVGEHVASVPQGMYQRHA